MAKRKKVSISSIFKDIYRADPSLLEPGTNDEIYKRYQAKTGQEISDRIKAINTNLKSTLRKAYGVSKSAVGTPAARTATVVKAAAPAHHPAASRLEQLEENIDECLTFAKNLDRAALESVINNLRRARNEVVWKLSRK